MRLSASLICYSSGNQIAIFMCYCISIVNIHCYSLLLNACTREVQTQSRDCACLMAWHLGQYSCVTGLDLGQYSCAIVLNSVSLVYDVHVLASFPVSTPQYFPHIGKCIKKLWSRDWECGCANIIVQPWEYYV
jgi:hypothetical protein